MHYQTRILPLDQQGSFLLAVYFPKHKTGGECTRLSEHAYFATGHVDDVQSLTSITDMCTIDRAADNKEALQLQKVAETQDKMGNLERGWTYAQQALKAKLPAQFVPRSCLCSRNGRLVIGFECEDGNHSFRLVSRVIDVFKKSIIDEQISKNWTEGKKIVSPTALSPDGSSFVYLDTSKQRNIQHVISQIGTQSGWFKRTSTSSFNDLELQACFVSNQHGRVAIDEKQITVYPGNEVEPQKTWPAIKGVFNWTAEASFDSPLLALSGNKGVIKVFDTQSGMTRVYYPHRGCQRDDSAVVKLSDDGGWMASKTHHKKELVVTCFSSGKSWPVTELEDQEIIAASNGEFKLKSIVPAAFAFIGDQLLVSEGHLVKSVEYQAPANEEQAFVSEQGQPGARKPLSLSPKANLAKIIKIAQLGAVEEQLKRYHSPAVKLTSKVSKKSGWLDPGKRGSPALGGSRLGGWPDLPVKQSWPTWQGRPMSFLAQINLAEVHQVNSSVRLPNSGLLLFFLGCEEETFEDETYGKDTYLVDVMLGSKQQHNGGWQVIYADENSELARRPYQGESLPQMFRPCELKMKTIAKSLPDEHTVAYEQMNMSSKERDNYNEVLDLLAVDNFENQLMGNPELIQFCPPELYCAAVVSGRTAFSFPAEGTDEYKVLQEQACDWALLLQLSSDDHADFLWGDGGHLYFYGKRKKMEAGQFDETWLFYEN